ncbi:S9 family peptidase [Robertkochia flava]|uniref:S9 family peptidase n=1 Tax=Robertkochia flava TaxID=3447986 RepID=UPI001CCB4AEB|nr:S9 family peptidase [Robertkochia marina]
MKSFFYTTLLSLILFSCKQDKADGSQTDNREVSQYSIEQFMNNEEAWGNGFNHDNSKVLLTSNRSGIFNLYSIPSTGGAPEPITQSDSTSAWGISYFPKDDRVLFRMDNNGDEIFKIFVKDSSEIKRLTPAEGVRALFWGWSKDGDAFYYMSNERDSRQMDLFKMDTETYASEAVFTNKEGVQISALSSDEKYLAYVKPINTNDSDLFLLNLETGEAVQINENQSGNSPQDFAPDNSALYYTTDEGSEFSYLVKYDIASGSREKVREENWDINGFGFSHDGNYSITSINEDARSKVIVTRVNTGETLDLPEFDDAFINGVRFSRDESSMLLSVGGSHTPTNTWAYHPEDGSLQQLTDVLNPAINQEDLVAAKVIRYPSFDSLEIPAIYYEPHQATAEHKVPAIVWVHGGPGGQSRQNYSSTIQYLVNHGYAVLAVNNRGSSGYGKTFYRMDDQNHGDKDLKDCIAGKDWLASQNNIDAEKIGILGGSYGGYMTMAAMTFAPEEFEVGVNLFGVTNWIRTLRSIPPWWESFKDALYQEMGDPNSADSVRLRAISPLFHTEQVTKPLLVLQGGQDPRVLQVESDEIVAGVKANGVPVEYVLFEDEGHGFNKKENEIRAYQSILTFLDTYLKKEPADPDMKNSKDIPES